MASGGWKQAHAAVLLGLLLSATWGIAEPQAASRVCRQLEADLAASSRGGGGGPALVRKYDSAIARQHEQISKARGQASRAGCGFSLFGRNLNQCAGLNATIDRMNANLDALQNKRERLAGGGSRRDRGRILAALDANGCRDDAVAPQRAPLQEANREGGSANLFDQLFGGNSQQLDMLDEPNQPDDPGEERNVRRVLNQPGIPDFPSVGGEFHTSCVRTCDGYFFPMSNSASAGDFERDQKNCESSCPGTEMQVFYSRAMGDDSASMTSSVTGRPYSELPTAYLYKQPDMSRPPACGCNAAAQGFQIIAGNPPNPEQLQPETDSAPFIPVPISKPDPGADPETLANLEGGLDREAIKRLSAKPVTSPVSALPPEQRKVRVVGPTFLPDPSAAIDLQAPAPKAVR
ncbi:DUF2865 domain-containing protein [Mesorhizobium sp. M7A.F.Ca.MR.245.00.0.0]|uniref:DUF2865 domain-containing protein n=1 Tax=Mesorhizobium sp. M7A.F.Ca.MR.245.00.0.0 TaxID=2496778 RepID=UPI000FCAFE63|nr:DUF2865 domain-containing protein [Mesorhizobium sp. M7A.F.Ca.MR.245.00.0.0]RUV22002.1 DUF2865 domain-containing protein [Mesorhizobium sp. M7A.F.Ca.MR.245.00.0.0]